MASSTQAQEGMNVPPRDDTRGGGGGAGTTMMTTMMTMMTRTTGGGRDSHFGPLLPTTTTTMPSQPDIIVMHVVHPTTFRGYYHPESMRAVKEEAKTTTTKIGGGDRCFGPLPTMMMMPSRPDIVAMHVICPTMFGGYYHPELMRAVEEEAGMTTMKIRGGDHCFGPLPTMLMMPLWQDVLAMHIVHPKMFRGYYHHPYYHHQPPTWMLNTGY
jgi:hypothetical protein